MSHLSYLKKNTKHIVCFVANRIRRHGPYMNSKNLKITYGPDMYVPYIINRNYVEGSVGKIYKL